MGKIKNIIGGTTLAVSLLGIWANGGAPIAHEVMTADIRDSANIPMPIRLEASAAYKKIVQEASQSTKPRQLVNLFVPFRRALQVTDICMPMYHKLDAWNPRWREEMKSNLMYERAQFPCDGYARLHPDMFDKTLQN